MCHIGLVMCYKLKVRGEQIKSLKCSYYEINFLIGDHLDKCKRNNSQNLH